jgi:diguanylate cyclase (GGDEF)-like protein
MRRWRPDGALGKARLGAAVFGCLGLLLELPQLGTHAHAPSWRAASAVAVLLAVGLLLALYLRERTAWPEPVLTPVLVAVAGSGLLDSISTTGMCVAALVGASLYGSFTMWLVRSAGLIAAIPVAVSLSPLSVDRSISWHDTTVIGIVIQQALLAVVLRVLYVSLLAQQRTSQMEALLAHTGSELLACTDVRQVRAIGARTATQLCELNPGTAVVILERHGAGMMAVISAGPLDDQVGLVYPESTVVSIDPTDSHTVRQLGEELAETGLRTPSVRHWYGVGLGSPDVDRFLLAGSPETTPGREFDAFRNLGHQVVLAEASAASHAKLYHQAHHDQLTSLPTRALLFQRLAAAVDLDLDATLMIIDLDDFKQINDTFGHNVGDELLVEVAERLKRFAGPNDVAARFGGDEFALLLTDVPDQAEADSVAELLCQRLREPSRLSLATVSVGASIGVAAAQPGLSAGDLMRCADIAMYAAKAQGKSRVERFSIERHGDIAQHRLIEEHLAYAVERREIVLRYQPYVDLRTGECAGAEAHVFWEHPTLGVLPLSGFVTAAERTGVIVEIGSYVLQTACRQVVEWGGPGGEGLRIAVNVAARQLNDPDFTRMVASTLRDTRLAANRLTLELLESEQMDDALARAQLHEVAATGVQIAIDDFGTGYVSLASLRSFPIHQLKIDSSFLGADGADEVRADQILQMVVSIGEILELETLAQGVRTPQQAVRLRRANLGLGQGSLFGEPMPANEFGQWLGNHAAVVAAERRRHSMPRLSWSE